MEGGGERMKIFDYQHLETLTLDHSLLNQIAMIHEYRGKQELYIAKKGDVLKKLVDIALIQSTDASNKIEGIATTNARLKQIVEDKVQPKNRNEEEIAGYRDVLKLIHEDHDYIPITANNILTLHKNLYGYSAKNYKGKFKVSDNVITEVDSEGVERIRFQPAPAYLTPQLVEDLCFAFNQAIQRAEIDPLILIPCFILDFLSIHPFADGNGRMSRLLTLLLLYQSQYHIGKYISIEMLIEKTKETYYEALQQSSVGWIDNQQDYTPFVRYFIGIILSAYEYFEKRFELVTYRELTPEERLIMVMKEYLKPMKRAELEEALPDISRRTIERLLARLQQDNVIEKVGSGRATAYKMTKH